MCRESGGASLQINWEAGDGGATKCDRKPVQETVELLHRQSSGSMPYLQGGSHITAGEGCSEEKGGVRKGGEGAEGGADSTVDGNCARARVG